MTAPRLILSVLLLTTVGLSACGRKSGLDTPYQASVAAQQEAQKAGQTPPPPPEQPVEDKPFILDPLL